MMPQMADNQIMKQFRLHLKVFLEKEAIPKIDESVAHLFARHYEILRKWNKTHNLISVEEGGAIISDHYLDCVLAIELLKPFIPSQATVFDLGSGNGFPGLIAALMMPDRQFVLVESLRKKCSFLLAAVVELGLKNVQVKQERVENLEGIEIALSRAAFSDDTIEHLSSSFGKQGILALMRVPSSEFPMQLKQSDWEVARQLDYSLESGAKRCVLIVRKKSST